ncbi:hypothetical protein [Bradyrhizobium archetypum]|jgi:hypothetical protein|uniref:DUF2232 domain-containing protein n=1 Tax=Bradyrhizobium archetypum TaxID=2721160 RepID=A0A7Y4M3Q6_9BRAD|nr:hypothetical protein [Bradyrhizobium archetypum]NOJ48270.1 hypothetical protein [Bradyrhizobium archetypum]
MIAIILIGLAAGCASALMFASVISRTLISVLLLYLASMPLMVAAIGWGPLSATVGGIAAALGIGAIFGFAHCLAYALTVALPAWWLGHLAMLGRPVGDGAEPGPHSLEWYPVGRLLLWIAGFAVLITILTLFSVSTDPEAIVAAMKRSVTRILAMYQMEADDRVIGSAAAIAPAMIASGPLIMLTINLWLAAKITATSGRLQRPWPDLKATTLPPMTLVVLCVAVAFGFTGGLLALAAKIVVGALLTAYALTGFAVLHTLTLALKNRGLWLTCAYVVMILFVWPLLSMVALGLADTVFGFRERFMRTRPPPLPTS